MSGARAEYRQVMGLRSRRIDIFILGVVIPWRRYNPAMGHWEWSCGFGYWFFVWGPTGEYRVEP